MRGPRLVAVRAALVVATLAGSASASELSWAGVPDCPDRSQLQFELERALDEPLADAGQLAFHVAVERGGGRVTARVRVEQPGAAGAADERVLVAATCSELTDTLVVAISLAIGRSESTSEQDVEPAPSVATTSALDMRHGARSASADAGVEGRPEPGRAPSREGPRPSAAALLIADVGSLPHPALGAGVGVELGWPRFSVQLGAALFYPQRARWTDGSNASATLGLTIGIARACTPVLGAFASAFSLPLCLGTEVGRMDGEGAGVASARSREILWMAPRADVGLAWTLPETPVSVETTLGAVLPLNRDRFIFDEMGTIHRPSRVAGRLGVNLSLAFD